MRGDSWLAMCYAASSVPLFFRYAVMPVARKVWFPILVLMPVQRVRRPRMARKLDPPNPKFNQG